MYVSAIIAAGGRGLRLGSDTPKQFLGLNGKSLLQWSVEALARASCIDEIIVALPSAHVSSPPAFLERAAKPVRVVAGGAQRQDSVANAFAAIDVRTTIVVVHDAARPFVGPDVIARTVAAAVQSGAAASALAVHDTVKDSVADASGKRFVRATLDRERIFLAQTPQAFRRDLLARAMAQQGRLHVATDEASLVEAAGFAVELVEGDPRNVKITTGHDLDAARSRGDVRVDRVRIGHGYDLHRLAEGRPLVLGGVIIPFTCGLDGHSDADVVCHAVTDAVLGAAGAGDIGRLFPSTDPQWKGADSLAMLRSAYRRVSDSGFRVVNLDVTVIAESPKLLPYLERMRGNLGEALECGAEAVSVKGKTNEGLDSMGRGESMACHAVALVTRA